MKRKEEGNNPEGINRNGRVTAFGQDRDLDVVDVLVFLLDKYDAKRTRGFLSAPETPEPIKHEKAIEMLRSLEQRPAFAFLKPEIQELVRVYTNYLDKALDPVKMNENKTVTDAEIVKAA